MKGNNYFNSNNQKDSSDFSKSELGTWKEQDVSFAPETSLDEDFPFESDRQFDDGRGNNFDPSWKERVLNAKVPESED
jgi:hypothetical protein